MKDIKNYEPSQIEPKWQSVWEQEKIYQAQDSSDKPKKYILIEFPYASGEGLHVGHCRPYTALDIVARKSRMEGYNVLFPFGWDAFGLPTENYAIKHGINPVKVTEINTANFKKQAQRIGFSFDWSREIDTSKPEYYKWTQWIFLQLYKAGLAYKKKMPINWCPSCKTGLANEEVIGGNCERCGTPTTKKELSQWMLKITTYADKLLAGLKEVDYLPAIKDQQANWIGRSEGASIKFQVSSSKNIIEVFTTRPDTLFGVTFIVLAPEHELIEKITSPEQKKSVEKYVKLSLAKSNIERQENKEKTGVFTGSYAINPINNEKIPVWVADYVLSDYGTGAIMAVPAHDQRDYDFAKKYDLPVVQVIDNTTEKYDLEVEAYIKFHDGFLINSGEFNNLKTTEAIERIINWLEENQLGHKQINYNLRDWVFSRQHYWGEPIPIVYCAQCGTVPLPEKDLPLILPDVKNYQPTDTGESPLASIIEWVNTTCPTCGGPAKRETDTMPNWAGSSWYYLRYCDPGNSNVLADYKKMAYWLPVDIYNGGMEHVTLHLLYSRFWHKFLFDQELVPTSEPYQKRIAHGMVLGEGGIKMSKSKGNVINPIEVINQYGADTLRGYEMFMGPYTDAIPWDTNGVKGVNRFLFKLWGLAQEIILVNEKIQETPEQWLYDSSEIKEVELASLVHKNIKRIGSLYDNFSFNTVVSNLMIFVNDLNNLKQKFPLAQDPSAWKQALEGLLLLLSPICPHICEELWLQLGHKNSINLMSWPQYDPELTKEELLTIPIQVNGKRRAEITVAAGLSQEEILTLAKSTPEIAKFVSSQKITKEIYVPGKIVNLVI